MPSKYYAIEAGDGLIKRALAQAAVTASGYIGNQWDQGGAVFTDFACIINIEACKISAGNEIYTFRVTGSNLANRSDAQILDTIQVGHAGTITIETRNTAAGDQVILEGRTEKNDTAFRFIDLHLTVGGTSPSITFGAYLARRN
jgi:hypothetical protein